MKKLMLNALNKLKGKKFFTLLAAVVLFSLVPSVSFAGMSGCIGISIPISLPGITGGVGASFGSGCGGGAIANALCTIVDWFNGPVGSAIASLAVIFLGISAFFGKVNWGTAVLFAVGIFAIFGAEDIIAALLPSGTGFTGC